ncbi:hypothetical protein BN59_01514 [Legionella massiliensis]|uniref:DUF2867 domain-containing protein n=1 Tax=Legionella massiliensis TaxID=1034943 RepID=A0A078KW49_9GAMM|nr:DUF2867 domain-containing protein [Legionella massiliensis]CDZ77232.1 hypothetical protein BN59_01514 [Legionella massiliensis]CEE12970.1 hypothetical protein BN1094_01514 [Legionella massiliensis]
MRIFRKKNKPFLTIKKKSVKPDNFLIKTLPKIDYAEALVGKYNPNKNYPIEIIADLFFNASPLWARHLLNIRNSLVGWLGLKTRAIPISKKVDVTLIVGERIGLFRLFEINLTELIFGEDDKHLDVRMILKKSDNELAIITLLKFHNIWGRFYFKTIRIFHQKIIKSQLKQVIKKLNSL